MQRQPQDGIGVRPGRFLDLDAALRRCDHRDRLAGAIQDEAQVVLLGDLRRRRDQHGSHGDALDIQAQDLASPLRRFVRGGGELDPTRLAATAHQHLRLDHHRSADALRRGASLVGRRGGFAGEEWHAVAREDLLAPVFLELHAILLMRV
jgi:hypothetical protein